MSKQVYHDGLWVVFKLMGQCFAVSSEHVEGFVSMPKTISLPKAPAYIRGTAIIRDQVTTVTDLRKFLGMKSMPEECEEFIQLMDDRERDHVNWLIELEDAVREKKEFGLARDPHKCKFGKWYDTYNPDDHVMRGIAKKFDEPHKIIHGIADRAFELIEQKKDEQALELIAQAREQELHAMIELFELARQNFGASQREIAMLILGDGEKKALAVDSVESVERLELKESEINALYQELKQSGIVMDIAQSSKMDEGLVIILNASKLLLDD